LNWTQNRGALATVIALLSLLSAGPAGIEGSPPALAGGVFTCVQKGLEK
jgi:hypothetical protein